MGLPLCVAQHSALSTQHSALSTQHSALSTQHSALSTQHSALSTQHSALSTQHSALSTQHSALSTQHSALSTSPRAGRDRRAHESLTEEPDDHLGAVGRLESEFSAVVARDGRGVLGRRDLPRFPRFHGALGQARAARIGRGARHGREPPLAGGRDSRTPTAREAAAATLDDRTAAEFDEPARGVARTLARRRLPGWRPRPLSTRSDHEWGDESSPWFRH